MEYQVTKMLCERVKQLEDGAIPLIKEKEIRKLGIYDSYSLAKLEYSRGLLKYEIKYVNPTTIYKN